MRVGDIVNHGSMGFIMGFYGTSTSRRQGVRVESDPINATPFWGAALVGSLGLFMNGQVETSKFIPYFIGLVVGGTAGAMAFDSINPDYEPPAQRI